MCPVEAQQPDTLRGLMVKKRLAWNQQDGTLVGS